jgi:hypothetical protein
MVDSLMLVYGSTPLPYDQYAFKIQYISNGVISQFDISQASTVRRIKKLVLDGTENFSYDATYTRFTLIIPNARFTSDRSDETPCTHYISIHDGRGISNVPDDSIYVTASGEYVYINIKDTTYTSLTNFKSYLAAQYTAGTPVTVWYVLANEQTEIVNEPLCKIGDYADELTIDPNITPRTGTNTLTIDTTLSPSSVSITGHIKALS